MPTEQIHGVDGEAAGPPPRKPPFIVAADEEEEEQLPEVEKSAAPETEVDPDDDETRFPSWAKVPIGLKIPAGYTIWFIPLWTRFMAKKTGGEEVVLRDGSRRTCRQIVLWECNLGDRRVAFKRAAGDPNRAADELTMQMIRAVDGEPVTWADMKSAAYPPRIWAEMGPKYRDLMHKLYTSAHVLSEDMLRDFFANCVEVRTAAST